jgi:hypothetical protein
MKRYKLINLLREDEEKKEKKIAGPLKTISKDLEDQEQNFKIIKTKDKLVSFLDLMVGKLDPKFKESQAFKQAILSFYKKHK